ncbi:MAG: hypothetical protein H0V30_08715 [Chitinophagaceae bacterium]|nr:hypothetical protein [Chitinophagaceae bacterium]
MRSITHNSKRINLQEEKKKPVHTSINSLLIDKNGALTIFETSTQLNGSIII